ncbi:MAG: SDR family oxidoreductase [Candidatus Woesearchaeota archaeon]
MGKAIPFTNKKVLVTGGAGFIGSALVHALVQAKNQVIVLDNFSTGKKENLAPVLNHITLLETSLDDLSVLQHACEGVEYVFHQAAVPSVPRSVEDPLTSHESGASATLHMLLAARNANVKRFVYASSSSVYGDTEVLPKHEQLPPNPKSPYAVSKLTGEYYTQLFYHLYGLETVCLRYFNVFGPRQDPHSTYAAVIPKFITLMLLGKQPTIYGDGTQSRDFTYVENVVDANLLACIAPHAAGRVFNIASGKPYSLLELVAMLNQLLGTSIKPQLTKPRPGDIMHSYADITNARTVLGYTPQIDLHEGLAKTIAWLKTQE